MFFTEQPNKKQEAITKRMVTVSCHIINFMSY